MTIRRKAMVVALSVALPCSVLLFRAGRGVWERCGRTWGNKACPCIHSDPVLPDCAAGETVRVRGKLWFALFKAQ